VIFRVAAIVVLAFVFLALLRIARVSFERRRRRKADRGAAAELVRDPVCGTWIDQRLALSGRRAGETVSVCSENCRRRLESA
jgi:YHS domain-containing protein